MMRKFWIYRLKKAVWKARYIVPSDAWLEKMADRYYGTLNPLEAFFAEWNSPYPNI